MGWLYGASAVGLGLWFTWRCIGVLRAQDHAVDRSFFMASNLYLMALFAFMLVDVAVL